MELRRRARDTQDADFRREKVVQRALPGGDFQARRGHVGVSDLGQRVDAGIGAAAALHADLFMDGFGEGRLEMILHRVLRRLALPAAEGPAIVGDEELEAEGVAHEVGV